MFAYQVTKENLPLITSINGGVEPKIEDEKTYFITGPLGNDIITEAEFNEKYIITDDEGNGRYFIGRR